MRQAMIVAMAAALVMPMQAGAAPARRHVAASRTQATFPYLHWPAGVAPKGTPATAKLGHFRFWDGSALQDVEGRSYLATLAADCGSLDDQAFRASMAEQLTRLGASRVASGRVPAATIATINADDRKALAPGLGDIGEDAVETWTLRRPHRQVWFQYSAHAGQAAVAVVEAQLN